MTPTRATVLTLLLATASCANGPPGPPAPGARSFDGTYAGELALQLALSPQRCPYSATGQVVMVIRGGDARIDVAEGTYFSGHVGAGGDLTLISGQGQLAFIYGRIVGGTYTASGNGLCQYQVRLTRQRG
jgi:hypothetical protein